ncbi:hypothetical protein HAX54_041661 [Datura stramonium]|uniref:Uncharacterized protein n=1 Tax=Datura stramonium TaxID=4076 RepID=A0ABS8W138_DATST|nr:hypothetical protein [Datura stramonium]
MHEELSSMVSFAPTSVTGDALPGQCNECPDAAPLLRSKSHNAEGAGTEDGILPVSCKVSSKDEGEQRGG